VCAITSVACGFIPYERTIISYPEAVFSPDGDWVYFVMRQTTMREQHDPAYPDDRVARAGDFQKDQVWLKRVRLADDHVESLEEWTGGAAGQHYGVLKSLPVDQRVKLFWKTGQQLAFQIELARAVDESTSDRWDQTLSGVWDPGSGKGASLDPNWKFPEHPEGARLHGEKEAIVAERLDQATTILIYDRSIPKATSYAVSPHGPFRPYNGISLLSLATQLSRRASIEAWASQSARIAALTTFRIRVVARPLTPDAVAQLERTGALAPVYTGTEGTFTPQVRDLFARAIAAPGSITDMTPPHNVPWIAHLLYLRQGARYFEIRPISP
jgi:hypothetical protein